MYNSISTFSSQLRFYLPESLDLNTALPPELVRYKHEISWLIHTLYLRRILDRRAESEFIPLKAAYLRRILPSRVYTEIRDRLEKTGIIEVDHTWAKTVKSKGYRLCDSLRSEQFRLIEIDNKYLAEKLDKIRVEQENELKLPVHKHLRKHFGRLVLPPNVTDPRIEVAHAAEWFRERKPFFKPCKYGRLHSNLTSLARNVRRHLTVDGKSLVALDVRNSQPLIAGLVLVNYFLNGSNLRSIASFDLGNLGRVLGSKEFADRISQQAKAEKLYLKPKPRREGKNTTPYDETSSYTDLNLPKDLVVYLDWVQKGVFYEKLMRKWKIRDRDGFKKTFFGQIFYCRNHRRYSLGNRFEKLFPWVARAISELKGKDFKQFNYLMSKVESDLILNKICGRLMNEYPDVFVATIHDCIVTLPEHVHLVLGTMREGFRGVGLRPIVNKEDWGDGSAYSLSA